MLVQAGLCPTCSETTLLVFPRGGSNLSFQVFNRELHFLYRLANPLFPPGAAEDVDLTFHTLPNGDLNATFWTTFDGQCQFLDFLYKAVPDEGIRAIYTNDAPFFTTGQPFTNAFFSRHPDDYVFIFFCLDRSKEIFRNGRRLYCNGPYEIVFAVYEYPPNRVKWCNAEKDLWMNYRLSFDNEFMKFGRTRAPCGD